jgi:hypothetical protein
MSKPTQEMDSEEIIGQAAVNESPKNPETEEDDNDQGEFAQEQLEKFQGEMQHKKDAGEDPHLHDIYPEDLGNEEHTLYKFFKKYKKEGWPELRVTIFEKKLKHYVNTALHDLIDAHGHKDRAVKSKNAFQAYLENTMLDITAERKENKRHAV